MKKIIFCAVMCALICQAAGCGSSAVSSDNSSSAAADAAVQSAAANTGEATAQAASTTEEQSNYDVPAATEQAPEVQTSDPSRPEQKAALSGGALKEISPDNVFVDYKYITGYEGTSDPKACGKALENAVLALKQTDDYKDACTELGRIENITAAADQYGNSDPSEGSFFDFFTVSADGGYEPIFHTAYIDDFDGDGKQEQFILLKFPKHFGDISEDDPQYQLWRRYYLAFADADGNAEILDSYWSLDDIALLDYGSDKQLVFNSTGVSGADDHDVIYGVVDGKAAVLYGTRGGFTKWNCFLTADGWQGFGAFMYYDTAAKEYRGITGVVLDKEEVAAMDTAGSAPYKPDEYFQATLIGGKYYCFSMGMMDMGVVYTFEDGKFVQADAPIRTSYCHDCVLIDDIDKVIAEMKHLEE